MTNLNHALSYAERGWAIFPLEPNTKEPLKWLAANGFPHGVKHATTDPDQIEAWWTQHPSAGIGLATGEPSGVWGVDADGADGVENFLATSRLLDIPVSPLVAFTGGGGRHYIYRYPTDGTRIGCPSKHSLGPRIHIRGTGGYLVVAPSIHPNGSPYLWSDDDAEPLDTPRVLIDAVLNKAKPSPGRAVWMGPINLAEVHDPEECKTRDEAVESLIEVLIRKAKEAAYTNQERHPQLVWLAHQLNDSKVEWERARLAMQELVKALKTVPWNPRRICTYQEGEGVLANAYGKPPREPHPFMEEWERYDEARRTGNIPESGEPPSAIPWRLGHPLNDTGNARRFAEALKDKALFVDTRGWMVYRAGRWIEDTGDVNAMMGGMQVHDLLKREKAIVLDKAKQEAAKDANAASRKALDDLDRVWSRHIAKTGNCGALKGLVYVARSAGGMAEKEEAFDFHPHLLNCVNGTMNLKTGEWTPHSPSDRLSRMAGAQWEPEASQDRWNQFLHEVFADQVAVIPYLQRVLGYCLTGEVTERQFWMFSGIGANGKDTLMGAVMHAMGTYADRINSDLFIQSKSVNGNGPTPEKAKLKGLRMVIASETPEDGKLNENEIKQITGGDDITARRLNCPPITFQSTHKIIILTNYKPHTSTDTALWDRLTLVEFRQRFEGAARDPKLKGKLAKEANGILAWLIEGARAYYEEGGVGEPPLAVRASTDEYRSSENIIEQWRKDRTKDNPNSTHTAKELFKDFEGWCEQECGRKISQQKFAKQLSRMGIRDVMGTGGIRMRQGLELLFPPEIIEDWNERHG